LSVVVVSQESQVHDRASKRVQEEIEIGLCTLLLSVRLGSAQFACLSSCSNEHERRGSVLLHNAKSRFLPAFII
jgi:hypothetical protein